MPVKIAWIRQPHSERRPCPGRFEVDSSELLFEYLFLQNPFDLSDLLLDFSGRLFSVAFSFESGIACHLPVVALTVPFTSCAVPLTSSFVPVLIFFSFCG